MTSLATFFTALPRFFNEPRTGLLYLSISVKKVEEISISSALNETLQNPIEDSTQISQAIPLKSQDSFLNSQEMLAGQLLKPLLEASPQNQLLQNINSAENLATKA